MSRGPQVEKKLAIAFHPGDGRLDDRHTAQSYAIGCGDDLVDDPRLHGVIAHDSTLADVFTPRFELRLDEGDDVGVRPKQRRDSRKDLPQGNERHVDGDDVERP
jgi:hypothetical protein